jgi:leader peptidase (prepilin peptidase) / N-methyltransferase
VAATAHRMPPPSDAARAGDWLLYAVALLVGLIVGSFLNVCIHRLPRQESVVWPASRCPHCAAPIAWHDNVPVLSWLLLRARCRSCGGAISARYPLVELATGLLAVLALARFGPTPWALVAFAFAAALLLISLVDLDHLIIPDVVSLPGILAGLAVSALVPGGVGLWDAIAGVWLGGGLLWLVAAIYEHATGVEGLGLGDAKLLAMVGAFLGWQAIPVVLVIASVAGTVAGLAVLLRHDARYAARRVRRVLGPAAVAVHWRRAARRTAIPFGPFLALGAVVALFTPQLVLPWTWVPHG